MKENNKHDYEEFNTKYNKLVKEELNNIQDKEELSNDNSNCIEFEDYPIPILDEVQLDTFFDDQTDLLIPETEEYNLPISKEYKKWKQHYDSLTLEERIEEHKRNHKRYCIKMIELYKKKKIELPEDIKRFEEFKKNMTETYEEIKNKNTKKTVKRSITVMDSLIKTFEKSLKECDPRIEYYEKELSKL